MVPHAHQGAGPARSPRRGRRARRRGARRVLAGVVHQVDQDLLDGGGVDAHPHGLRVAARVDESELRVAYTVGQTLRDPEDERAQVHGLASRRARRFSNRA